MLIRSGCRRGALSVASIALAGLVGQLGLGACRSDAASGASGAAATTAAPKPKVTVAGDSISIGLGAAIRTADTGADVKVIGEEGTGLARPDRFDWPGRLQQLAAQFPPAVLVFSLGSNDAQDLTDATGKVVATTANPAAWDAEYSKRLAASFDAFAGSATTVLWVGPVHTADPRVGATNRHIQQLATAVTASRPFVQVQDLATLLGTGEQAATRCLVSDGLHLTVPCLDEAAAKLVPALPH